MGRLSTLLNMEVPESQLPPIRPLDVQDRENYRLQKGNAKRRGIPFRLTFDQWLNWWHATGHYHERGNRRGEYVMARKGDQGAYELGNIDCIQAQENSTLPHLGKGRTIESRMKRWRRDLLAAGWEPCGKHVWRSPGGQDFPGLYAAWTFQNSIRRDEMKMAVPSARLPE